MSALIAEVNMITHTEEYKGHTITIDTQQEKKRFRSTYQIDGGEQVDSHERGLSSEKLSIDEAVHNAKFAIDSNAKK